MWVGESQGNQNCARTLAQVRVWYDPFKFSIWPAPCRPILLGWPRSWPTVTVSWGRDERWDFNLTNGLTQVVQYVRSSWFNHGSSLLNDISLYSSVSVLGKANECVRCWVKRLKKGIQTEMLTETAASRWNGLNRIFARLSRLILIKDEASMRANKFVILIVA